MTPAEFTITRTFDAPREEVWRAWTDPSIAARWWHPHDVTIEKGSVGIDLREGGDYGYTMVGPHGTRYPTGGTYLEVSFPERLRFTWAEPGDPPPERPVITVDLTEAENDTCRVVFHCALRGVDDPSDATGIEDGWSQAFTELALAL